MATKLIKEKCAMLDAHFFKFLAEQGVTESTKFEEIRDALEKAGLEVINDVERTATQEIYTFKLVRVLAKTSLNIPMPKFEIGIDHAK